jgi:hypothetical protein
MIIYTNQRSKKRKPNAKQRQLAAEWQEIVERHKKASKVTTKTKKYDIYVSPVNSNLRKNDIPSLNTGYYNTFRKPDQFYTGTKMVGIGTLHKSNAVPIFSEEEAKDQATMRR